MMMIMGLATAMKVMRAKPPVIDFAKTSNNYSAGSDRSGAGGLPGVVREQLAQQLV